MLELTTPRKRPNTAPAIPSPSHPLDDVDKFEPPQLHPKTNPALGFLPDPATNDTGLQSSSVQELLLFDSKFSRQLRDRTTTTVERTMTEQADETRGWNAKSGEKRVIVHKVLPSDTLAGVALFYGIAISTLKRVNKLWSNDSIHMRVELFIPLDECAALREDGTVTVDDQASRVTIVKKRHIYGISSNDSGTPSTSSFDQQLNNNTGVVPAATLLASTMPLADPADLHLPNTTSILPYPNPRRSNSSLSTVSTLYQISSSLHAQSSFPTTHTTTTVITASIQTLPAAQFSFFPPTRNSDIIKHRSTHMPPFSSPSSATSSTRPSDESSSRSSATSTSSVGSLSKRKKRGTMNQNPASEVSVMGTIMERLDTCGIPVYRTRRRSEDGDGVGRKAR
ncbi:hypothetical protein BC938DRAFT_479355, partial [Jimgerdemannia flammicorona]